MNLSDYLIHLKPVKYFDFVMESKLLKTSDFVTRLALVTHCLFQSGFVSSSLNQLSFDFVMEWTFPKLSLFVSLSDYLIRLKPVKYFDFVMESRILKTSDFVTRLALVTHCLFQSAFVSASLLPLSFGFVME